MGAQSATRDWARLTPNLLVNNLLVNGLHERKPPHGRLKAFLSETVSDTETTT